MAEILIIDDDIELCEMLTELLCSENHVVNFMHTGKKGIDFVKDASPQMVILDVMLPDTNGFEVLKEIRKFSGIPVLMLTAKGEDIDRIIGLELGADDYLPKPFNARELLARVRAIFRRTTENVSNASRIEHYQFSDMEIDVGDRSVVLSGNPIDLTNIEFELLHLLAKGAGKPVERSTISKVIFDRSLQIFDRSIDVHISSLRRKIGKKPDGSDRIKTVRGVGYLLAKSSREK